MTPRATSIQFRDVPFETKQHLTQTVTALRKVFSGIIADEMITENGLTRLNQFYESSGVPNEILKIVRDEAFQQAAHMEIVNQGAAKQDTYWLLPLARKLGISPNLLSWMEEEVSTLTILNHIESCEFDEIPVIKPESVILKPGEKAFLEVSAMLFAEAQVDSDYTKGLAGISFRLARGIPYQIGGEKSELLAQKKGLRPTAHGSLLLTNRRMIFSGDDKTFSVEIGSLFGTRIFADSIQFTTLKDEMIKTIGFQGPLAAEYCAVVLSRVMNS